MDLKYFEKADEPWRLELEQASQTVCMKDKNDGRNESRVILATKSDGNVIFTENCDQWFSAWLTRAEAVEMLRELIAWIEDDVPGSGRAE